MKMEYMKALKPINSTAALSEGEILYWAGTQYEVAIKQVTDEVISGVSGTEAYNLAYSNIVKESVTVLLSGVEVEEGTGSGKVVVDYVSGAITFGTEMTGTPEIKVTYKYFAGEPDAILAEDVTSGQSPAAANVLLEGVYYSDLLPSGTLVNDDVIGRLAKRNIFIEKRPVQVF